MIKWPQKDWQIVLEQINIWKKEGNTIVFTNGCFDLIHPGHLHLIYEAKKFGDRLIIGLNTDKSVKRLKGENRPIKEEQSRGAVLAAIHEVDLVVLFDDDTPLELIQHIEPNILVKGGDYNLKEIVGSDVVISGGGSVEIVSLLEGYSTSNWVT